MSDKIIIVLFPDPITVYDEQVALPAQPVDPVVADLIAVGRPLTHIPPTVEAMQPTPATVAPHPAATPADPDHPDIYLSDGSLLELSGAWVQDEDGNYSAS